MIWPPPSESLEGRIVRLEPISRDHFSALLARSGEPEVWRWMDRRIPGDPDAFQTWFEDRLRASGAAEEWCFVTQMRAGAEAVGSSSYLAVREAHDGLEIGWTWLHPDAWRTGANREAKLLMLELAFERLGCMRVEFKTDARNERSREALSSLGATFEGIFRKHMHTPVVGVRDSAYFSITDEEWPEVRDRIEAGLRAHAGGGAVA